MQSRKFERTEHIRLADAIMAYYSVQELAEILKITRQAIYSWRRKGKVPPKHALTMEKLFGGRIKACELSVGNE